MWSRKNTYDLCFAGKMCVRKKRENSQKVTETEAPAGNNQSRKQGLKFMNISKYKNAILLRIRAIFFLLFC